MSEKRVRFDDFVLDFGRFQLLRGESVIALEGLPLQLLMFLIERQGQLVTREQIADELWGHDVFVDVEQGINTAIRKVRRALEDDSSQPHYLQTVVGRGYRFVGRTEVEEEPATPPTSPSGEMFVSAQELGRAIMSAAGLDPENPKAPPKPRRDS